MDYSLPLTETTPPAGASRAWSGTLADGTHLDVIAMYTITADPRGHFESVPVKSTTITYPDGTTRTTTTNAGHIRATHAEAQADVDRWMTSHGPVTGRLEWWLTIGRMLTDAGISLDNDAALAMLGDGILSGRVRLTDVQAQAVRRLFPS